MNAKSLKENDAGEEQLNIVDDMLKQGQAAVRKARIEHYEIFANCALTEKAVAEKGALKTSVAEHVAGIAVRVFKNGRLGFAKGLDAAQVAKSALQSAELGQEINGFGFQNAGTAKPSKPDWPQFPDIETLEEILEQEIEVGKGFSVPYAEIEKSENFYGVANSAGTFAIAFSGAISCSLSVNYDDSSGYQSIIAKDLKAFESEKPKLLRAKQYAKLFHKPGKVSSAGENRTVILRGEALAGMFWLLAHSLTGESHYLGTSTLKLGKKEFGENITLIDTQEHEILPTALIDGEGLNTEKKNVIMNGVLQNILCKTENSHRLKSELGLHSGIEPGNALRLSYNSGIGEGFNCGILLPGKGFDIEKGELIIENVQGLHTVDKTTGEFSLAVDQGFLVNENGDEIPVSGFAISGNVFRLLRNCKLEKIPELNGNLSAPWIKTDLIITG